MEKFQDILSEYMEQLDCTGRALANEADVSPVLLSRYKNGTRVPKEASPQVLRIARAIERLAAEQGIPLSHPDVNGRFQSVFADPAAPD
ncbi:MAG: helix-turn-helix transcriptional regulator, partial [Lachnospiraceae bacterium]|nr:helix-turn-helix transcriptional regulator [Candidatus Hippenecus merdae]